MKQFVDKFLDAFYKRPIPMSKDELSAQNTKQSEVVQEFYKKINKYILTSASIRAYLERLNYIKSLNLAATLTSDLNQYQSQQVGIFLLTNRVFLIALLLNRDYIIAL